MPNQNPEQKARDAIDAQLRASGWAVQDKNAFDSKEGAGQAVREYTTDSGPADYVLFVDKKAVGVIEAKKETLGQNITTVEDQTKDYSVAKLKWIQHTGVPLPFLYEDVNLDIHHIFPQEWCRTEGIDRKVFDSIINKTPISYKANRMIGKKAPSLYLDAIQKHKQVQIGDEDMDAILESHRIDSESLRADDFEAFMSKRARSLLDLVGGAMRRTIETPPESSSASQANLDDTDEEEGG
jgi:hypothetical protein